MNVTDGDFQASPAERMLARKLATLLWMIAAVQFGILLSPAL